MRTSGRWKVRRPQGVRMEGCSLSNRLFRAGRALQSAIAVVALFTAASVVSILEDPPARADAASAGQFVPSAYAALLDTRTGTGAAKAKIPANGSLSIQVTGKAGLPSSGVSGAFVSVSALSPVSAGALRVSASGATTAVDTVRFDAGRNASGTAAVKVGADGKITLTNASAGTVDAAIATSGYFLDGTVSTTGNTYSPVPADGYLYDTVRGDNWGVPGNKLGANASAAFGVAGHLGVPANGATAVAVDVTVKDHTADGWVSLYPVLSFDPNVAAMQYSASGGPASSFQIVPLNANGLLAFTNHGTSPVNVSVTIRGYYTASGNGPDGLSFVHIAPQKVMDTVSGTGVPGGTTTPLAAGQSVTFESSKLHTTPDAVAAASLSIHTQQAETPGWLSVYPADASDPNVPSVSFPAGSGSGSEVPVTSGDQKVTVTNHSSGTVHIQAAVNGYYVSSEPSVAGGPPSSDLPDLGTPDGGPAMPTTVETDDSDPDDRSEDPSAPTVAAGLDESAPTDPATAAQAKPSGLKASEQPPAAGKIAAAWTSWCRYSVARPFTLTAKSRDIYAQGKKSACGGSAGPPDSCHAGVDLEAWNLTGDRRWHTIAHNGGTWKRCKGAVTAVYKNCHYQPRYKVWYRSALWLQIQKRGRYGTPGWAYSNTRDFYCD
ncbi:hypothetical protein AB0J52_13505 [Spirillospora sp. NPDC049652]